MALETACLHKAIELRYKAPKISHIVAGLLRRLDLYTEDPDGVGGTVNIFMFTNLSLSASSEATMVSRRWGTAPDSSPLVNFKDIASLLQRKNVDPVIGLEAAVIMLEKWKVFFEVILGTAVG